MPKLAKLGFLLIFLFIPALAFAQTGAPDAGMAWTATDQGWIQMSTSFVCRDDGAILNAIFHYLWPLLGIPFMASVLGNFRSKLSPGMNAALDVATGDIVTALKAKVVTAAAAASPQTAIAIQTVAAAAPPTNPKS